MAETAEQNDSNDSNESNESNESNSENRTKRKRILIVLALVVVLGLLAYGIYWFIWGQYSVTTDDAYVGGNVINVSPQVSGTVVSINAENTDLVHAGDVLVRLDPTDAGVALNEARANLAQTVRQVRQLFDQAAGLNATVTLQKASYDQALRDYRRAQDLQKVRGISTQDYQHAETSLHTARASYQQAQHQLAASQAAVAGTTLEDHPQIKLAEARLRQAYLSDQRTRILAPVDGYVAQRNVQVGQQVQPGSNMMAVVPLNQVWVDANYKETELADVRIGQPVELTADLYGGDYTYHGKVAGLAAGTGDAFALLPPQNATGNWIKVVQRLPVRIQINAKDLEDHPLRIGLSTVVSVDTHDRSGKTLAQAPIQGVRFDTPVYQHDARDADALIQSIIDANRGETGQAQ